METHSRESIYLFIHSFSQLWLVKRLPVVTKRRKQKKKNRKEFLQMREAKTVIKTKQLVHLEIERNPTRWDYLRQSIWPQHQLQVVEGSFMLSLSLSRCCLVFFMFLFSFFFFFLQNKFVQNISNRVSLPLLMKTDRIMVNSLLLSKTFPF